MARAKKYYIWILYVIVSLAGFCHGDGMEIDTDLIIQDGDSYDCMTATGSAQITMTGGSVYNLWMTEESRLVISDGHITDVYARDHSVFEISGGSHGDLMSYDTSYVKITGGTYNAGVQSEHDSIINVTGGIIRRSIWSLNSSTVNLSGGRLDIYLVAQDSSTINIYAYDIEYDPDGVVEEHLFDPLPRGGSITGTWADGTSFALQLHNHPDSSPTIEHISFHDPSSQTGRIIYVDDDAAGANNGTSWENAYMYLQDALMFASQGDEIRVAQGVYRPDEFALSDRPSLGRAETFVLKDGITLKGGYAGAGNPEARDIDNYPTILSGDLNRNDNVVTRPDDLLNEPSRSENAYHVVTIWHNNELTVLDGFTVTGGNANDPTGWPSMDCWGGGMIAAGTGKITNCTFRDNTADWGGGLYLCWGQSNVYVSDCSFFHNAASHHAGAMEVETYAVRRIDRCRFSDNYAGWMGGAVWNFDANPHYINCLFTGNRAGGGGGAVWNVDSGPYYPFTNCTFSGNIAAQEGGAIVGDGWPTMTNCIFWNNQDMSGNGEEAHVSHYGGMGAFYYCCVQGWTGTGVGVGNIGSDPLFINPGFRDQNMTPEDPNDDFWVEGDYHLKSQAGYWNEKTESWMADDVTSPCIDAGDPSSPIGHEPFPNGGFINMGAYGGTNEASKSYFGQPLCQTIIAGDINGDCIVSLPDFAIMAFNWLENATESGISGP